MNLGLSDHLKESFPNIVPAIRPLVVNQLIANPQWLAGFASAEGCFFIGINKSSTTKTKVNIQLEFQLTQHIRDEFLIKSLVEYWNCGSAHQSNNVFRYRVSKFWDLSGGGKNNPVPRSPFPVPVPRSRSVLWRAPYIWYKV